MIEIIHCLECGRCIKIEGSIEGLRKITFSVPCPHCDSPNDFKWPMAGQYKVSLCDEDEISK
jgi:hypothetical protein